MCAETFKKYARYYDLIYEDKPYKWEAEMVYKWAHKPKSILDLGVGTGKHAQYWADKALIVGIDSSKEMLKRVYKHPNISYQYGDITKLNKDFVPFQAVFAMFNVVGYLDYYEFNNLLKHLPLRSGAYFIFDCWDYDKIYLPTKLRVIKKDKFTRISFLHHAATVFFYIYDRQKKLLCNEAHEIYSYSAKMIREIAGLRGYKVAGFKDTNGWGRWWRLKKL